MRQSGDLNMAEVKTPRPPLTDEMKEDLVAAFWGVVRGVYGLDSPEYELRGDCNPRVIHELSLELFLLLEGAVQRKFDPEWLKVQLVELRSRALRLASKEPKLDDDRFSMELD